MYISGWIVIHKPYMVTVFHWREVIGMVRQLLQLSVPVTMVTYVTCIWLALKWWLSGWVVKGIDWPIKTTKTWPSDWLIWPFMVIVLLHESANIREIVTYLDRFLLVCVHHELQGHMSTNRSCRRHFWLTLNTHQLSVRIPVSPYRAILCTQRRQKQLIPALRLHEVCT